MPDFVRVVNTMPTKFQYHSLNVKKIIPPGKETMMPWDLACSLFGDPFTVDSPRKPDRTDALRRARSNWNYELGMETMEAFDARRQHLEVYDMETSQRLYMLIDDPDGEHTDEYVSPAEDSTDQMVLLQRQVQALTAQLTVLIDQQVQNPPSLPLGQTSTVSTDGPTAGAPVSQQAVFVDNNPFAQREDDILTEPLFDFAALSTLAPGELPPTAVLIEASTDTPRDAGVGSEHADSPPVAPATPKLAARGGKSKS